MDLDRRSLNLSVLQRVDPSAHSIVGSASHVVLYTFNVAKRQWHRSGVEGTLFLVWRRTPQNPNATLRLIIMNRLRDDNFILDIGPAFRFDVIEPYLMFSHSTEEGSRDTIQGAWFHGTKDRETIISALSAAVATTMPPRDYVGSANAQLNVAVAGKAAPTHDSIIALQRDELKAVLLSLVANDRFIDIIHAEYLARRKKR